MKKLAYLTGATGCVGRNLVDVLLDEGWELIVLHRPSSDLSKLQGCNVRFQSVNLHDSISVQNALREPADAVFHVAGNTSHWAKDAMVQWKDNVLATRHLAEAALAKGIKRFIFTSTGATNPHQWTDEEQAQKIPVPYIRTKRLSELEVYKTMERGLDAVIIKPIIVMGKYDYHNYSEIFKIIAGNGPKIVLPGKIVFCDAKDVARAHLLAFERGKSGESYVLPGEFITWLEVSRKIAALAGKPLPQSSTPLWLLWLLAYGMQIVSQIIQKSPPLTPEVISLLNNAADVTYYEKRKIINDLNYTPQPIQNATEDCFYWMKFEGML